MSASFEFAAENIALVNWHVMSYSLKLPPKACVLRAYCLGLIGKAFLSYAFFFSLDFIPEILWLQFASYAFLHTCVRRLTFVYDCFLRLCRKKRCTAVTCWQTVYCQIFVSRHQFNLLIFCNIPSKCNAVLPETSHSLCLVLHCKERTIYVSINI